MTKPKKTKPTGAAKSAAYGNAFPKHQRQDEFVDAAIALRAEDLASAYPAVTKDAAIATARAEFDAALNAVLFPPTDGRFYFLWKSSAQARILTHYTQTVWASASGRYGDSQPMHYEAKPKVQN